MRQHPKRTVCIINILNDFLHIGKRHVCLRTLLNLLLGSLHGLINYIDTKAKCRHLKYWPVKGLFGKCLSKLIDWRYIQSYWYFLPSFVSCCPSNLLSGSCVNKYSVYMYTVCKGGGGGSVGVSHYVSDQIQNLQNCFTAPNKNLGGEGASDR